MGTKTQIMFPIVDQVMIRGIKRLSWMKKGRIFSHMRVKRGLNYWQSGIRGRLIGNFLWILKPRLIAEFAEIVIPPGVQPALNTARDIFEAVV